MSNRIIQPASRYARRPGVAPATLHPPSRPRVYKSYCKEQSLEALEDVHSGPADGLKPSFRVTEAARGVPRSTLGDYHLHTLRGDSRRYPTDEEEAQLATFILQSAEIGYGKSCSQVHALD